MIYEQACARECIEKRYWREQEMNEGGIETETV
jgi:hypothetical protein